MADAVGTQTETVLIRALAAGVTVRSVLRRELLTGLVMGIVIGAAFYRSEARTRRACDESDDLRVRST